MNVALAAVVAAPGLVIGSFLNVVASRVPERRGLVLDRSACMSCDTQIAAWENIPLLSYALLRGRCRSCKAAIPIRYPVVEALTALLIVACVLHFGLTPEAVVASFFCSVVVALSAIYIEIRIVPINAVRPRLFVVIVELTAIVPSPLWALGDFGATGVNHAAAHA